MSLMAWKAKRQYPVKNRILPFFNAKRGGGNYRHLRMDIALIWGGMLLVITPL